MAPAIDNRRSSIVNPPRRLAVIDVGTNTVRLLVAEVEGDCAHRTVLTAQEITRLGQGLLPARELQPEPIRRTVHALRRYREEAEAHGAATVLAVGTSALREAENRAAFLTAARDGAGVEVAVVAGEEEARLALLGVRTSLPDAQARLVMMDIGGGSTELLLAEGEKVLAAVSTGLGAVKLTERCLAGDPPRPEELEAVRRTAAERLGRARKEDLREIRPGDLLVGTAGTVTSLAAVDLGLAPYEPNRVTGHRMTRARIAELVHQLAFLPLARRRQVRGLEPARADVIVAGGLVCLAALDALGLPDLTVSDGGLREGILMDLLRRSRP